MALAEMFWSHGRRPPALGAVAGSAGATAVDGAGEASPLSPLDGLLASPPWSEQAPLIPPAWLHVPSTHCTTVPPSAASLGQSPMQGWPSHGPPAGAGGVVCGVVSVAPPEGTEAAGAVCDVAPGESPVEPEDAGVTYTIFVVVLPHAPSPRLAPMIKTPIVSLRIRISPKHASAVQS